MDGPLGIDKAEEARLIAELKPSLEAKMIEAERCLELAERALRMDVPLERLVQALRVNRDYRKRDFEHPLGVMGVL